MPKLKAYREELRDELRLCIQKRDTIKAEILYLQERIKQFHEELENC